MVLNLSGQAASINPALIAYLIVKIHPICGALSGVVDTAIKNGIGKSNSVSSDSLKVVICENRGELNLTKSDQDSQLKFAQLQLSCYFNR
jgi:hypothetical protein